MKNQPERSLFASVELEQPFEWRSHATSIAIHLAILGIALLIPVAVLQTQPPVQSTVLYVPPPLKEYKPKITAPKRPAQIAIVRPKPVVTPPPVVRPPEVKPAPPPPEVRPAPIRQHVEVAVVTPAPKPEPVAPPIPQIRTGVFETKRQAVAPQAVKDVKIGGFGDPNGARPSESRNAPAELAKVGQFDLSAGANQGSGGRRGAVAVGQSGFASVAGEQSSATPHRGVVVSGSFGDAETGNGRASGHRGTVHNGGFGDMAAMAPPPVAKRTVSPQATPVEILYKPKPIYTPEARDLKLEGNVLVDVIFCASGEIRLVRVVQGLGHGLDEAARQAVLRIKFRPATRDGSAVDTRATVNITFEVT
jgi:TonB family protein